MQPRYGTSVFRRPFPDLAPDFLPDFVSNLRFFKRPLLLNGTTVKRPELSGLAGTILEGTLTRSFSSLDLKRSELFEPGVGGSLRPDEDGRWGNSLW